MHFINLTPHDIQLVYQDPDLDHESIDIIPASGILARCDVIKEEVGTAGPRSGLQYDLRSCPRLAGTTG